MLTNDDRIQINETLALHAYIFDANQLDRLAEIFTPDAVYDMTLTGIGAFEGIDTIRTAASRMAQSGHAPIAHFVTNVHLTTDGDAGASAKSRGLMIMANGAIHAVTHDDTLRRHNGNWRISRRVITPLRTPVDTVRPTDLGLQ